MPKGKSNIQSNDPNDHTTQGDQVAEGRIEPRPGEPAAGENDYGDTRHADVAHDVRQEDQPANEPTSAGDNTTRQGNS